MRRAGAWLTGLALALTGIAFATPPIPVIADPATPDPNAPLILLVDVSGSMNEDGGAGETKLEGAKDGMAQVVGRGSGNRVGIWTYPGDGNCSAGGYVTHAEPIQRTDASELKGIIDGLEASGNTPTAQALEALGADLIRRGFTSANIVLVSDGESNCSPPKPPCDVAADLVTKGFDVTINTIGFNISSAGRDELQCIANQTHGRYVDAADSEELIEELQRQATPLLEVHAFSDPHPVAPGDQVSVTVEVRNTSTQIDVVDVTLTLSFYETETDDVTLPVIPPRVLVGTIPAGQWISRTWAFSLDGLPDRRSTAHYRAVAYGRDTGSAFYDGLLVVDPVGGIGAHDWGPITIDGDDQIVIMGDSYSSGQGVGIYEDWDTHTGVDRADANGCHTSQLTYGYDGDDGRTDKGNKIKIIACSGAVMTNFVSGQIDQKANTSAVPQFEKLSGLSTAPRLVFLTIGGNDIGFAGIVKECVIGGGGCASANDPESPLARAYERLAAITAAGEYQSGKPTLANLYRSVWEEVNTSAMQRLRQSQGGGRYAPVVVLPYVRLVQAANRPCVVASGYLEGLATDSLSTSDLIALNKLQDKLNTVIESEVEIAANEGGFGIYFASGVVNATLGHTLCDSAESMSYINPIQLESYGLSDLIAQRIRPESVHPDSLGYSAIGRRLRGYLNSASFNFNPNGTYANVDEVTYCVSRIDWPKSDPFEKPFDEDSGLPRSTFPKTDDGKPEIVKCGYAWVDGQLIKPGTSAQVVLHSQRVVLANLTADENGNVAGLIAIPGWVEPGIHALTLEGLDMAGKPVIYTNEVRIIESTPWYVWVAGGVAAVALLAGLVLVAAGPIARRRRKKPTEPRPL